MNSLMASFHCSHYDIPLAFYIGAIGMKFSFETGLSHNLLTRGDIRRDRDPHTKGDDTYIHDHMHYCNPLASLFLL